MFIEHASVAGHAQALVSAISSHGAASTVPGCRRRALVRARRQQCATPALLLKLLFTSAPLSIQVHPDDASARAMGIANGKSEAWYNHRRRNRARRSASA